ncbi:cytochrome c oxidase subunit II [Pokkaliibacter plantistimulans]|uniref:Cytochrome c oxidase subunit 2 n=1 Tax=Proteobacteria bacterium 228 TaxID=2083153 RepID=A0A2S5KNL2_9PROT|nr:cytochrome c oxidase subunit II [Pokkaliibacter plantistimulans]PPC76330.1 cytochrome c oxidase subunit II [Pokkaliibacter plantistimulans]
MVELNLTKGYRLFIALYLVVPQVSADLKYNMPVGVTEVSHAVHSLHMTIFWICVAIAVIVFGVMFWSIFHHRKSRGAKAAQFHENTLVEIIWTLIPLVILVAMAVPATATLIKMYDTSDADVDIQITGYQWKWHYKYVNDDIEFFSTLSTPADQIKNEAPKDTNYLLEVDQPLVLPVGKKVRFLVTSNDVIHSWWVPDLAVKRDAIPGFINEAWTKIERSGTYRGQCAELCGKDHGFMPIVVEAKSEQEYSAWVANKQAEKEAAKQAAAASATKEWSHDELMAEGEKVYARICAACHQPTGMGIPSVFPALKGSPVATGNVQEHINIVLHGRPGTAMQAFAQQLSTTELAAVITYERNAWDNNTGDTVLPQAIQAVLDKQ